MLPGLCRLGIISPGKFNHARGSDQTNITLSILFAGDWALG